METFAGRGYSFAAGVAAPARQHYKVSAIGYSQGWALGMQKGEIRHFPVFSCSLPDAYSRFHRTEAGCLVVGPPDKNF